MDETVAKSLLIVFILAAALAAITLVTVFVQNIGSDAYDADVPGEIGNFDDMELCQYWSLSTAETLPDVSNIVCFSPTGGGVTVVVNAAKTQARCMFTKSANEPYVDIDAPQTFHESTTFFALSDTHTLLVDGTNLTLHTIDLENEITWSSPATATASTTAAVIGVWFLFEHFVVITSDLHIALYSSDTLTVTARTNTSVPITAPKFNVFNNGNTRLCIWSDGILHLVSLDTATLDLNSVSPPGLTTDNVLQIALSPDSQTLVACVYSDIADDTSIWMWNNGNFQNKATMQDVRDPAPWQARSGYGMIVVSDKIVIVPSVTITNSNVKLTNFYLLMMKFENRQLDVISASTLPVPAAELVMRLATVVRSTTTIANTVIAVALDIGSADVGETNTVVRFVKICHQR